MQTNIVEVHQKNERDMRVNEKADHLKRLESDLDNLGEPDEEEHVPDQLYMATRVMNIFKRTQNADDGGCCGCLSKIVEYPLNFIRNYTCPMADFSDWDRNRASILPLCLPFGFCLL